MSWISELADKAENILNKIDKNAATALQISDGQAELASPSKTLKEKLTLEAFMTDMQATQTGEVAIDLDAIINEDKLHIAVNNKEQGSLRASPVPFAFGNESQELSAFKIALAEITRERDDLREQVAILKNQKETEARYKRAQELETLVIELIKERDTAQREVLTLRNDNNAQIHTLTGLETSLAKIQQQYRETVEKLQMQLHETSTQRQQFDDYRIKAQRALQAKDAQIAELQNETSNTKVVDNEEQVKSWQTQLEAVQEKYNVLLQEKSEIASQLEALQQDALSEQEAHATQLEALRVELRAERELALATASEQRLLTQELCSLRQQMSNQMAAYATKLQEKEQQMQNLLAQQRAHSPDSSAEQETRLQTLTAALVDKQTTVERITAERNALRIQLEKFQDQLQQHIYNNQNVNRDVTRNTLLSNSTDDAKAQFPGLLTESPFDTRVTRRVKRGFSSLDSVGVRLGTFLRRYPLMRVFVLMYVGLLHIWVMFVLLSSTPN